MPEEFDAAKMALLTATALAHLDQYAQLFVMIDVSATHIGVDLQQR
jgi:hypothetical protein